jgi:hypothetical protein
VENGSIGGYFDRLGREVSDGWTRRGRGFDSLAEVSEEALLKVDLPAGLDAALILEMAARSSDLPAQSHASDPFGQPPLVLHREADFFVLALTWMDGTTAIHEHGFAGAFMILEGMSLHVVHDFMMSSSFADGRLAVGQLETRQPEVLRKGMARRIDAGGDFIHALFHLEQPTVTVVVRNTTCGLRRPQYSYRPPGLAWDGLFFDKTWTKRIQSVDTLKRLRPEAAWSLTRELVSEATIWEAYMLLDHWCLQNGWDDRAAELAERLASRVSDLRPVLAPGLAYDAGVRRILVRRGLLKELHQRLLLALLANLPQAAAVVAVMRELFPGKPPAPLLLDWVEELSSPSLRGVSGLSLTSDRISELRRDVHEGSEIELLSEFRRSWGDPIESLSRLFT